MTREVETSFATAKKRVALWNHSQKRKPSVLLVQPPISFSRIYSQFASAGSELPPLGLCYLAARIRQEGYPVQILDCMAERLSEEQAVRRIAQSPPDFIGITLYTPYISGTVRFIRKLKVALPNATIVTGGGHITSCPRETLESFPEIDLGVIGEGEEVFVQLLNVLSNRGDFEEVPSLAYRTADGEILTTPRAEFIQNLDVLPMPAWDLLPYLPKYYLPAADSLNRFPVGSVITSRGCPGKCTFCNLTIFGRRIRAHSPAYILEMIQDQIKRFGVREIFFQDDTYLATKRNVRQVSEMLLQHGLGISWSCYGRVDMANRELFQLMKRSGCWQISFGMETGDQEILDFSQKHITLEQTERAVCLARECGIRVKGLFMLGNFQETPETIAKTQSFILKLPLSDFHMTFFTPFPGSESYRMAMTGEYGWFDPSWDKLDMWTPSFVSNALTERQLWAAYKKIYRAFYLRPRILAYYASKLKSKRMWRKIGRAGLDFLLFMLDSFQKERLSRAPSLDQTGAELVQRERAKRAVVSPAHSI